jgi:hypothetical protein
VRDYDDRYFDVYMEARKVWGRGSVAANQKTFWQPSVTFRTLAPPTQIELKSVI